MLLTQFFLQIADECIAPLLDFILPLKQLPPALVALLLQLSLLLLPVQIFIQCRGGGGGAAHLFNLAIDLIDLLLQANLEVI